MSDSCRKVTGHVPLGKQLFLFLFTPIFRRRFVTCGSAINNAELDRSNHQYNHNQDQSLNYASFAYSSFVFIRCTDNNNTDSNNSDDSFRIIEISRSMFLCMPVSRAFFFP